LEAQTSGPPAGATADTVAVPETEVVTPARVERRVRNVSVRGNTYTDSTRIVRTFDVPLGTRFAEDAVKRGIRKLFALGLFSDAWVETLDRGDFVDLVIHVEERPRIGSIGFSGNRHRENEDLEKKLILRVNDPYVPTQIQSQIDSLARYYREEGYARAKIASKADTLDDRRIGLTFQIDEGEKVKIERIVIEGATAFPQNKLRKQLESKQRWILGGGDVKDENFPLDREKLEAYYQNRGYRDMRVLGHELRPGSRPDRLVLAYQIEEGVPHTFGDVRWSGNQSVPLATLERMWRQRRDGVTYDRSRVDRVRGEAYAEYAEQGYLYLEIEPRESVRDSNVVDVTYIVTEGQPSKVRYVTISGNKGTREHVIRRELTIHEGAKFKRSALVRSQGDIFRLGLFEDVQIDFAPADSTDVDVILRVKEKQVGTASAGAGYTSESGVTGFLELGHNNVLGNGQSLNLHLERGAYREDYYLSFTEPWFRGTPTLLGFSLFNTEREREDPDYEEHRIGGSVRIGRPLPWPDYSRGSISYRLENVTIDTLGNFTESQRLALSSIRIGEGVLTSSVNLLFNRNSADNPFYPTKGSRLTLESELAGGAFGGAVNFNKHRGDGRLYFPSLVKGVTTMLRARLGVLSHYIGQEREVPVYERFRLGGGSTVDPLRGYDDFQVVPGKYIRDVEEVTTGPDGDDPGAEPDTVSRRMVRIRYPGGRFMSAYSIEQQFAIVHPLHGVLFFDAGNTWDLGRDVKPFDLKLGTGIGFRLEIPLLGNVGFDYAYGFHRDDGPKWKGHFLIGNVNF
jgi:outer membrane protein insertion porin family